MHVRDTHPPTFQVRTVVSVRLRGMTLGCQAPAPLHGCGSESDYVRLCKSRGQKSEQDVL